MDDPIVEEVRKARQNHANKFGHDLSEICKDLKKIEKMCGHEIVTLPPKPLTGTQPDRGGLPLPTDSGRDSGDASLNY